MISKNIQSIRTRMNESCAKTGRDIKDTSLIVVSKTQPIDALMEAYHAGERDFGENKVQELLEKEDKLPNDIRWHMIGHLQRNKVKYIVDKVFLIHSVDSLRLAQEISKEALKKNTEVNILIEVNIAEEKTKFGITSQDTVDLITQVAKLPAIHIKGLMTIAPYVTDSNENRHHFARLRELAVDITHKNIDNISMSVLSMGMTGDYDVAIEEGATYIRVGTGIFGERNYNI